MKREQTLIYLVLVVISILLIHKIGLVKYRADDVAVISQAFNTCGAKLQNFQIDGWTQQKAGQDIDVVKRAEEIINQMADSRHKTVIVRSDTMAKMSIRQDQIKIGVVVSKKKLSGNSWQLYQTVHVEIGPKYQKNIEFWRAKVQTTLKNDQHMPVINTCLVGYFDDKLSISEQRKIIEKLFYVLDAKVTEKIETDSFTSVAGYSPLISNHLLVNGNKINVQMAVRYQRYNHGTYVMIGCPVITQEY